LLKSETYKQLLWGLKHIPTGPFIFALDPIPSWNPLSDPASVVTLPVKISANNHENDENEKKHHTSFYKW
jgi:hypothetical protein